MSDLSKRTLEHIQSGCRIPADNGNPTDTKPSWFDLEKFQRAKEVFLQNRANIFFAHLSGLILVFLYTPTIEPFLFTGKSSSIPALRRRYLSTSKRLRDWYIGNIWDPKDGDHKSVLLVRKMHKNVAEEMDSPDSGMKTTDGSLFFSQAGMAHTQFAFVGWIILYSEQIGLCCTKDEMECLLHFWRCVGYLLGFDDNYNICSGTYEESVELCKDIVEKDIKKRLKEPRQDRVDMSRDISIALGTVLPLLSWLGLRRYWYEILNISVDFRLGLYDTVCYWWYRILFGVLFKSEIIRRVLNSAAEVGFNHILKIYKI